jgi:RNA polymerase sigma-70 factor (ECF subfamily)
MTLTEQIWRDYHAGLHGFIRRRVGDAASADDILQDVFVKVHARIDGLREKGKVHVWLYRIARNAIIDYYRTRKTPVELPQSLPASEEEAAQKARQELAGCIVPMIENLPDHYRRALMLSEIDGLTQKETAAQLGLSLPGAKARIRRGRAKVKEMLLACCHLEFDRQGGLTDYESRGASCGCDQCGRGPD